MLEEEYFGENGEIGKGARVEWRRSRSYYSLI